MDGFETGSCVFGFWQHCCAWGRHDVLRTRVVFFLGFGFLVLVSFSITILSMLLVVFFCFDFLPFRPSRDSLPHHFRPLLPHSLSAAGANRFFIFPYAGTSRYDSDYHIIPW